MSGLSNGLSNRAGTDGVSGGEGPGGPWDQAVWFEVPFPIRSKSNFRRSSGASRGEWARQRSFEDDVRRLATAALPATWERGDPDRPLPSRPVVVVLICARTLLDAANLSKSVLDACEGTVFHNDASAALVSTLAERGRAEQSGTVLCCRLAPGASPEQLLGAASALGRWWLELRAKDRGIRTQDC